MKREIKFRAWDKNLQIMSNVSIIEWDKWNQETPIYIRGTIINRISDELLNRKTYQEYQTGSLNGEEIKAEDVILRQFTNLTDKNGDEIYEGDIIKFIGFNDGTRFIRSVVYLNGKFEINEGVWNLAAIETKEVIGNIYENPELSTTGISK